MLNNQNYDAYIAQGWTDELLVQNGLVISGTSPSGHLVEIIEVEDHPWYVGVQFHPELKSRPTNPHPLFRDFVGAAVSHKK